jgi:pimeloyl-ACP methyl ester carboxylesterase
VIGVSDPGYLGTMSTDFLSALCEVWPVRELPADHMSPVASDVPVLLLSGEVDPVTPPRNADLVLEHLSNARHLVAPGQGHGIAWRGCAPKLIAWFIRERNPAELDAACLDYLAASPFFIDRNGPTP